MLKSYYHNILAVKKLWNTDSLPSQINKAITFLLIDSSDYSINLEGWLILNLKLEEIWKLLSKQHF